MKTNDSKFFVQRNGFSIDPLLHDFVETSLIPATPVDAATFWNSFGLLMTTTHSDNHVKLDQSVAPKTTMQLRKMSHSPINATPEQLNPTWGSLYDALYHDNVIPHATGLKPGNRINMARRERVVRCAKDFLDKTYPLIEGSHQDAVSYMAYFQNLLVILADGTTTGLQHPKQFIAKRGPSESPDSILLKDNNTHTEILFDPNSEVGTNDLAGIEDIQLETTQQITFDFNAATPKEKCAIYSNWINIVSNQRNCSNRANVDVERTITTSGLSGQCTLVLDQHGTPVPDALIDASIAAIIETSFCDNTTQVNLCFNNAETCTTAFITELAFLLGAINTQRDSIAINTTLAACAAGALSDSVNCNTSFTLSPNVVTHPTRATIETMLSHGYDTTRAYTL